MNNENLDIISNICQQNTRLNNLKPDLNTQEPKIESGLNDTTNAILLKKEQENSKNTTKRKRKRNKESDRLYYLKNREKIRNKQNKHRHDNKEKINESNRLYRNRNKEELNRKSRKKKRLWRENNPEKCKEENRKHWIKYKDKRKIYYKNWRNNNKEKINKCRKDRKKNDIQFRLSCNLRSRMHRIIKKNVKVGSVVKNLGCTLDELKIHLENQFINGMTWENYGKGGWEIDHIKPVSLFDLTDRNQFLQACHYTNLQPLWATTDIARQHGDFESIGNLEKRNKY